MLGELKSLAGAGDEGEGSGWLKDLGIRDTTWEIRDTLLRWSWLREARERANAPAWLGQFPGAKGNTQRSQSSQSRPEAIRRRSGYSPELLWERNQASASVRAHTCTEPLIHSEAAGFREHRGLVDR